MSKKRRARRLKDGDLWRAVEIAVRLTENPNLQDALRRATEILKMLSPSPHCTPSAPPRSKEE